MLFRSRPALAVLDAVVGLDGGPAAIGRPVQVGRLLAATNAAALDVVACRIIGYEPSEVATLERAQASGMIGDFSDVEVLGTIEPHHFKRLVRGPIARSKDSDGFFVTATSVDLKVTAACTRCRACIGACPVGAITDSGRRVAIDRQLCLNCYHCLAVCPEDAIRMAKEVPDLPAADRWTMWLGREELLAWQPQSDVAKPYPPAPKAPQGDRP